MESRKCDGCGEQEATNGVAIQFNPGEVYIEKSLCTACLIQYKIASEIQSISALPKGLQSLFERKLVEELN